MSNLVDTIIEDIIDNQRPFISGNRCNPDEVKKNLDLPVLFDGLNIEEKKLILSAIPKDCTGVLLSPMDKGLSGSKVFSARFIRKRQSKPYIIKIGQKRKLEQEAFAIIEYACPHILGISPPILRKGLRKAMLVQEFAGVSPNSKLVSLRQYIRYSDNPKNLINKIFNGRFSNWYTDSGDTVSQFRLESIFEWYFAKVTIGNIYPDNWDDLKIWVEKISNIKWTNVQELIHHISPREIKSISSIIHGDLHSQNILIDESGECWPIDFAWCNDDSSPVVDAVMLECSLKFMAIPQRSDLRSMIEIENLLSLEAYPDIKIISMPYCTEISKAIEGVLEVRRIAIEEMKISFSDYRLALFAMTYTLSTRPQLNRPFALASLQILSGVIENE